MSEESFILIVDDLDRNRNLLQQYINDLGYQAALANNGLEAFGWAKESCELVYNASPLHDVGKLGIPDKILLKPEKLSHDEWKIMKTHTTIGANILKSEGSELETMAKIITLTHHEKWDDTGYSGGLKEEDIPIEGRIVAIVDVFDNLTFERPFKEKWPIESAVDLIENASGTAFDLEMVIFFKKSCRKLLKLKMSTQVSLQNGNTRYLNN
jgi:putative two-component system response regulator